MHTHPQFRSEALLYRGLCNERRLFILSLLLFQPYTGVELKRLLNIRPACVTKHLRILMTAGLIQGKREKMSVKFFVRDAGKVREYIYHLHTPFS